MNILRTTLLLFAMLCVLTARGAEGRDAGPADVRALREEMQARMRAREAEADAIALIPIEPATQRAPGELPRGQGALLITSKLDSLRAVLLLTPEDGASTTGPLRATLEPRSTNWLHLPAGAWRVQWLLARGPGEQPLELPAQTVQVRAGRVLQAELGEQQEQQLARMLAAQNKRRLGQRDEATEDVATPRRAARETAPPAAAPEEPASARRPAPKESDKDQANEAVKGTSIEVPLGTF